MIHILNPIFANYSANPSPIPSLPPVMTAQDFYPYLYLKSFEGRMNLTRVHKIFPKATTKKRPPITAKK